MKQKPVIISTPMPTLEEVAKKLYGRHWKSRVSIIQKIMKKPTPRDKYLQKKYGITEEEYDKQLERQGGGCLICGSTPKARPLHVDHDHKIEKWKIDSKKISKGLWRAWPRVVGIETTGSRMGFYEQAETKPLALAKVRARLKRLSVRGLLCFPCNKGLQVFRDDSVKMVKSGGYILNYKLWLRGSMEERQGFNLDDGPDNN